MHPAVEALLPVEQMQPQMFGDQMQQQQWMMMMMMMMLAQNPAVQALQQRGQA